MNTRVAPSPTGEAHVGTAYVALFNRMTAHTRDGQFILRVEDTDTKRTVPGAEDRLKDALNWLGLTPDAGPDQGGTHGPYRQSERLALYRDAAWKLVDAGYAYPAFESSEELEALRAQGHHILQLPSRDLDPATAKARAQAGEAHTIRFKAPRDGHVTVHDLIRGDVTFPASEMDDKVLIKQDGGATYHMAATYDDRAMGISTVIRAEEWLTSTPTHVLLHRAFQQVGIGDTPEPEFAHLPLLRNADKSKISKRKNPTGIDWYRREGFLPDALLEFLATMGWGGAHDLTLDQMPAAFDIRDVRPGAPVFDLARLKVHNGARMHARSDEQLRRDLQGWSAHTGQDVSAALSLPTLAPLSKRTQTLKDLAAAAQALLSAPVLSATAASQAALQALLGGKDEQEVIAAVTEAGSADGLNRKAACAQVRMRLCGSEHGPSLTELRDLLSHEQLRARLAASPVSLSGAAQLTC